MATDLISPIDSVLFEDVCLALEKLYKKKGHKMEQNNILLDFINNVKLRASNIRDKKDANLFPLMRLLAPQLDRERNAYNIKEDRLAQILVGILRLNKQSEEGKKILKWRANSHSKDCDFAGEVYYVLKNKAIKSCNLTIGEINNILDKLALNNVNNKKQLIDDTFGYVLKNMNANQLKWFFRIILKDLKFGIGSDRILAALDAKAPKLYEKISSLSKICEVCDSGSFMESEKQGIQIFCAVKPMLSKKLDIKDVCLLSNDKKYQVEEKFDGERFQVHMENGVFEYFSRRGYSSSKNYGVTYEEGLITPLLKGCIANDVSSFILDGEMMGWHKNKECFGSKGMEYDIKKITEKSVYRPCFCAFDILYYNGKNLVDTLENGGMPLKNRLQILDTLFTDVPGVIQHSKRQVVDHISDILEALNDAMENQEEGIVVKDIDSYYMPNERDGGWYKIKPEYTEGAMTELDLVIIGADEAENKRHGRAKCFLVACLDQASNDDTSRRWVCVGRVATGLTDRAREQICATIQLRWSRAEEKPPPPHLVFNKSKPDFWVEPEHSIVLQIRASELTRSTTFGTTHTLRFPRVVRVREDKPIDDVMRLDEFKDLVENKGPVVKLNKSRLSDETMEASEVQVKIARKRKVKPPLQVAEQYKLARHDDVEDTSKALMGRKVCILSDDNDCSKAELEKLVKLHGGINVASIANDTWCCVVGRMNSSAVNAINSLRVDVVTAAWLRALPLSDHLCTLNPLEMLAMKKSTKVKLARQYDDFGDAYTKPTDEDTLRRCFEKIDDDDIHLTTREMQNLDAELFGTMNPYSFLRSCCIHFVQCDELQIILAKMYGAIAYGDGVFALTHVVVSRKTSDEETNRLRQKYVGVQLVTECWLEECFAQEMHVPEAAFII